VFLSLYRNGIRNFVFPLGYKGTMIETYIREVSRNVGGNVIFVHTGEDSSIASRISQIAPSLPEGVDFLLLNSDTIFEFDIEDMYRTHKAANALVTLSSVEVVSSWGLILLKGEDLVGFDRERKVHRMISKEAPGLEGVVNSGMAWLNKDAIGVVDLKTCGDFETSVYSKVIQMGRAAHYQLKGCWFPIDSPKDLQVINLTVDDRHGSGYLAREVKDRLTSVERGNGSAV
ncbi:MAG: glucose-1-phosphate cytidylyltransferase, partial [Acidobacteria bacterium]|nr:glucose-1-phosphate cytidylyltransferase [Acidobacteriota bacterium]